MYDEACSRFGLSSFKYLYKLTLFIEQNNKINPVPETYEYMTDVGQGEKDCEYTG